MRDAGQRSPYDTLAAQGCGDGVGLVCSIECAGMRKCVPAQIMAAFTRSTGIAPHARTGAYVLRARKWIWLWTEVPVTITGEASGVGIMRFKNGKKVYFHCPGLHALREDACARTPHVITGPPIQPSGKRSV